MNTKLIKLHRNTDKYGKLVPIEENETIPFPIKRVYYIYEVDEGVRRGFHSHKELNQVLICVSGSVKILLKTPLEENIITFKFDYVKINIDKLIKDYMWISTN